MTINPTLHIYNIQLIKNVFRWNLFISKFSSAAPINENDMDKSVVIGVTTTAKIPPTKAPANVTISWTMSMNDDDNDGDWIFDN